MVSDWALFCTCTWLKKSIYCTYMYIQCTADCTMYMYG